MADQYTEQFFQNLNKLRQDGKYFDVEIFINKTKFEAHRNILSASSIYFQNCLETNAKMIEIYSIDPNIFRGVLDFIYTRKLERRGNNIRDLLIAGQRFQLPEMIDACCNILMAELSLTNALELLTFADTYNIEKLIQRSVNFICLKFSLFCQKAELLKLSKKNFFRIIWSDYISYDSSAELFDAVVDWLQFDPKERHQYIPEIMMYEQKNLAPESLVYEYTMALETKLHSEFVTELFEKYRKLEL